MTDLYIYIYLFLYVKFLIISVNVDFDRKIGHLNFTVIKKRKKERLDTFYEIKI